MSPHLGHHGVKPQGDDPIHDHRHVAPEARLGLPGQHPSILQERQPHAPHVRKIRPGRRLVVHSAGPSGLSNPFSSIGIPPTHDAPVYARRAGLGQSPRLPGQGAAEPVVCQALIRQVAASKIAYTGAATRRSMGSSDLRCPRAVNRRWPGSRHTAPDRPIHRPLPMAIVRQAGAGQLVPQLLEHQESCEHPTVLAGQRDPAAPVAPSPGRCRTAPRACGHSSSASTARRAPTTTPD